MKVVKIIIYILLGLLIMTGAYSIYMTRRNSPQKTVEKVLELRGNYEKNKDEIRNYMTKKYFDYQKGDNPQINSAKCQLSSYKNLNRVAVLCKIQTVKGGKIQNEDAAVFYLVRSGLYPFSYRYQIDDIEVIDPALVETFSDILVKKEVQEESFGLSFNVGGLSLLFDDFKCETDEVKDSEDEVIKTAIYSFKVRESNGQNITDTPMFFKAIGENDSSYTSITKSSEKVSDSEVNVRLVGFNQNCEARAVEMQNRKFDKKYKVNIK